RPTLPFRAPSSSFWDRAPAARPASFLADASHPSFPLPLLRSSSSLLRIMSSTSSSSLSTAAALWRLKPFIAPIIGRLVGGALSALGAAVIALMIPIVLEQIVRGPVQSG